MAMQTAPDRGIYERMEMLWESRPVLWPKVVPSAFLAVEKLPLYSIMLTETLPLDLIDDLFGASWEMDIPGRTACMTNKLWA
jgi:hypothetical protein